MTLAASGENWVVGKVLLFILLFLGILYEWIMLMIRIEGLGETISKEELEELLNQSLEDDGKVSKLKCSKLKFLDNLISYMIPLRNFILTNIN